MAKPIPLKYIERTGPPIAGAIPVTIDDLPSGGSVPADVQSAADAVNTGRLSPDQLKASIIAGINDDVVPGLHGVSASSIPDKSVPRWSSVAGRAVFSTLPQIDLRADYGIVVGDVSAAIASANVDAINRALSELPATGGIVVAPPGKILLKGTVIIPTDKHVGIEGQGISHSGGIRWGTVFMREASSTGDMFSAVGTGPSSGQRAFVSLRKFGIHGSSIAFPMVRMTRVSDLIIDQVRFSNSNREALIMLQVWNALISNTMFFSSGDAASSTPAVRISAPAGEDATNGIQWTNSIFESNRGTSLSLTGTNNFSIRNYFSNIFFEDADATTWPLVELARAAATHFSNLWLMKGRKSNNLRATGPLIRQIGPGPTAAGEVRANIINGANMSYWGDTQYLVDQTAGALVMDNISFSGDPSEAYVHVASTVGPNDFRLGQSYAELPAKTILDERSARYTNTTNGHRGALAPTARGWSATSQGVTANGGRVVRLVPNRNIRATSIAFSVSTLHSTDIPVDVGIYDSSMSRLVSSGPVLGLLLSTGAKSIPIAPTRLIEGATYYLAISVGTGGTGGAITGAAFQSTGLTQLFGAIAGEIETEAFANIHPLPPTLTPASGSPTGFALAVRED